MRQTFLLLIIAIIVVSLLVAAIYMVLRSLLDVVEDWQTNRELKELKDEVSQQTQAQDREHEVRLQNDCEHQWEGSLVGFPPGACVRCGLEKVRPRGSCDHVWRVEMKEAPGAVCETCGKEYQRASTAI